MIIIFSTRQCSDRSSKSHKNVTYGAKLSTFLFHISLGRKSPLIFTLLLWVSILFFSFSSYSIFHWIMILIFFLLDKEYIRADEICVIEKMLKMLIHYHRISMDLNTTTNTVDEDEMCTICFAFPISVIFEPCKHNSCRYCFPLCNLEMT